MSHKFKSRDNRCPHFITCTVVDWINLFTHNQYRNVVINGLRNYRERKNLKIFAYCIMTNQIYLILGTEDESLGDVCSDLKRDIALLLKKRIAENPQETRAAWMLPAMNGATSSSDPEKEFQLWEDHFHPIPLTSKKLADQKLRYLHSQPVTSGYVQKPEDFLYSSARNYAGQKAIMKIDTDLKTVFTNNLD